MEPKRKVKSDEPSLWQRLRRLRTEPVMALFCIGYYMPTMTFVQSLAMDKSCNGLYGVDRCRQQSSSNFSKEETDAVQEATSQVLLYYNLMSNVPALVLTVALGHWSDLHGRRLVLLLPTFGNCVTNVLYVLVQANDLWPADYIVWAALPFGVTGGYLVFMMGIYGWLRDIHPIQVLATRIAINDGVELISIQLGTLGGTQLYTRLGYGFVFGTAAVSSAVAVTLIEVFTIAEDHEIHPPAHWTVKLKDLFHVGSILKTNFKMLTVVRKHDKRAFVWLMCIVIFIGYFNFGGASEIGFMFTRLRVHWDAIEFSYYMMAMAAAATFGCMVVTPIVVRCFRRQPDMTVALTGQLGNLGYHLMTAFATTSLLMYVACSVYAFAALTFISYRAVIAKCVHQDEIGKLIAMSTIIQTVGNNLGRMVMTKIYMATLATSQPWTCNVIFAVLSLISVVICLWMMMRMRRNGADLNDDGDENELSVEQGSNTERVHP